MVAWPHRLFSALDVVNYYDRPYLASMLIAGSAAVVGVVAVAVDLLQSPYKGVAIQIRRAVHAPRRQRDSRFAAALRLDPGVPAT
jgi:hypothetical protein